MDRTRSITGALAVTTATLLGAATVGPIGSASAESKAVPNVAKLAGNALAKQKITWSRCSELQPASVQCATIKVPQDWHDAQNGKTWDVAISYNKLNDHKDDHFKGAIMGNPGGPGGSGLSMAAGFAQSMPDLNPYYNYIGFDPRGTGKSSHASCEYTVDPNDTSKFAEWKAIGKACAGDPQAKTITTEQTTYDMDFIRHLLGLPKLNYLGYSYGTWLGSWYSKVFWSKADLMVLDSALDVTEPTYQHDKEFEPWAFPRRTKLWSKPYEVRQDAAEPGVSTQPAPAASASTEKQRTFLKAQAKSSSPIVRKGAERRLKDLSKLTSTMTKTPSARARAGKSTAEASTFVDMSSMIRCGDGQYTQGEAYWKAWYDKVVREIGPQADNGTLVGFECLAWRTQNKMPVADPKTYPKTIVVHSELDANTVWEHGSASGLGLPNTKFIAVDNESQHGVFPYGTEEVDRPVLNFFLEGKLPKPNVSVSQGLPRFGETETYEYWKPINKKGKHYGELVTDPWQKAGTPTIVPTPVTGAEIVREGEIQAGFHSWVLQNYGIEGWNLVKR
ncbi:alpha/beta fold hydrolase [Demetria terragena]|uniref:alpha/beta fold hydrolase n=1 Tax=Demetria terragena TaxID=63959 RepID=UPI00036634D7|nr:alpha/beta fold hydrolase [Demetria terragena]